MAPKQKARTQTQEKTRMTDYGNHRFEHGSACSACGVTEEALQDNVASKCCANYRPPPWGRVGMFLHWTTILFLVGTPLAGLIGAIPAALISGAVGLLVAEVHAGMWDEFMDSLAAEPDAERGLADEIRRVLNGEVSQ